MRLCLGVADVETVDDLQRAADSIAAEHELPHGSEVAVFVTDGSWVLIPVIQIDQLIDEITGGASTADEGDGVD